MFGDEIIEGFSFLRLNTNEKIRSINYSPEYFIRSLSIRVESRDKGTNFLEKKKPKENSID